MGFYELCAEYGLLSVLFWRGYYPIFVTHRLGEPNSLIFVIPPVGGAETVSLLYDVCVRMVCISTGLFAFLKFGILKNTRRNFAKIFAEMFIVSKPIF